MKKTKYKVTLTKTQREILHQLLRVGKSSTRQLTHARILLKADEDLPDAKVAEALEINPATVWRVRQRFVQEGFDSALAHKHPRTLKPPKLTGREEARLMALACGAPPEGRARWTLRLLADKVVELEIVEELSYETVRKTLKKMNLSLT
jgi:hypothetical protein